MEVTKNERTYRVCIPVGAPLGEVYDAVIEVAGEIVSIINQQVEKAKPKKPEEKTDKIIKMDD
jgi:hypothetical protein